jgi:putative ABC transport system permease protein
MLTDVRHAIRFFRRRPAFTVAIVLTLGLGIGANTSIFTLVRAVLLRPLPYQEPHRLVVAWRDWSGRPSTHTGHGIFTGADVIEIHRRSTAFDSIAVVDSWGNNLRSQVDLVRPDGAERLRGAFVTPNFFELLGVRAALGRTFDSRDVDAPLVVLSDAFWRRRFGADPSIVGLPLELTAGRGAERQPMRYLVAGVLPSRFRFTYPLETEVWGVLPWARIRPARTLEYQLLARLKPGVTADRAQAEVTPIVQDLARANGAPESYVRLQVAPVEPLTEHVTAEARPGVLLLIGAAAIVLLIACVNVALLLIALLMDRRREFALRSAIGGTRRRIVRQLFVECAMLAGAGAVLGVALTGIVVPALRAFVPTVVPRGDEISLDWLVLGFAGALAVLTAIACSLAPFGHAGSRDVQGGLRHSSGSITGDRSVISWRRAIVATQVAVVFTLLVAASLLLHSFWRMQQVDLGFQGEGVVTMEMRLLAPRYRQKGRIAEFQRQVLERIRALPGVEQASLTSSVPMRGVDFIMSLRAVGGAERTAANARSVDPEYFSLMRIKLLAGRVFTAADDDRASRVAIVSQAYGRALFGDQRAIGKQLNLEPQHAEIVGVVADVRHVDVTKAPMPAVYFARAQDPTELICIVVRSSPGAGDVAAAVRAAVQSVDPGQPVEHVTTLDRIVRESTADERFYTWTTAGFGLIAVLLAVAGLAGVVSRTVTERVREIAIRLSLGAQPRDLVRLAIRHGMAAVGIGLGAGALGAWTTTRLLTRFLFDVSPLDPLSFAAAGALLTGASLAACYLPARRVTRVEPMMALKTD